MPASKEITPVNTQLVGHLERRRSFHEPMKDHDEFRTRVSDPIQSSVRKDVEDAMALSASILHHGSPVPRVWTLVWWKIMTVGAMQSLRMQVPQQPRITAVFVEKVVQWEAHRRRHRQPPGGAWIEPKHQNSSFGRELQPGGHMSREDLDRADPARPPLGCQCPRGATGRECGARHFRGAPRSGRSRFL